MGRSMQILLDRHDQKLFEAAVRGIGAAFRQAHKPAAVAKKIVSRAVRYRNQGRTAAKRRHPFQGVCEISGKRLLQIDAHLDELYPSEGFTGGVRWVCPKANNSGLRSCGGC